MRRRLVVTMTVAVSMLLAAAGCKPSDVLSVPPPANTVGFTNVKDLKTAESIYAGARTTLFGAIGSYGSLLMFGNTLGDEFAWAALGSSSNIDARYTSLSDAPAFQEVGDGPLQGALAGRSLLILSVPLLRQFDPPTGQWQIGEAYALIGYSELLLAEDYCAGVTLSYPLGGGGFVYGQSLTTDQLLQAAEAQFDTALANAHGSDTVLSLARVGLGRALLDRDSVAAAAQAVSGVSTSFVYNVQLEPLFSFNTNEPDFYGLSLPANYTSGGGCPIWDVADGKGQNGLNYRSAQDPRLVLDSTLVDPTGSNPYIETCDQLNGFTSGTWHYPSKFGDPQATGLIPLATGVEARLIAAEAALKAGNVGAWTTDLNTLRAQAPNTYLAIASAVPPLSADSTTNASSAEQVDVLFRERAFWLFGTGTRLGDMRRLIRQYGRNQNTVFPVGKYPNGASSNLPEPLPVYGTDVDFTLPTPKSGYPVTNPNYKGCLAPTSTA